MTSDEIVYEATIYVRILTKLELWLHVNQLTKGAFVWDQSGIIIIGIIQVSVRLAALPIPEYLDFHSGYSAPSSRIAGIYSRIFPNERAQSVFLWKWPSLASSLFRVYAKY